MFVPTAGFFDREKRLDEFIQVKVSFPNEYLFPPLVRTTLSRRIGDITKSKLLVPFSTQLFVATAGFVELEQQTWWRCSSPSHSFLFRTHMETNPRDHFKLIKLFFYDLLTRSNSSLQVPGLQHFLHKVIINFDMFFHFVFFVVFFPWNSIWSYARVCIRTCTTYIYF